MKLSGRLRGRPTNSKREIMGLREEVTRLADGTRTVKEIAHEIGNGVSLVSVYRVIRQENLRAMVASAYGTRGSHV